MSTVRFKEVKHYITNGSSIEYLNTEIESIKAEYPGACNFIIVSALYDAFGESCIDMYIEYERPETEEEYTKRTELEKVQNEMSRNAQYRTYLELKKIFDADA